MRGKPVPLRRTRRGSRQRQPSHISWVLFRSAESSLPGCAAGTRSSQYRCSPANPVCYSHRRTRVPPNGSRATAPARPSPEVSRLLRCRLRRQPAASLATRPSPIARGDFCARSYTNRKQTLQRNDRLRRLEPGRAAGSEPAVVFAARCVVQRLRAASRYRPGAQLDRAGGRSYRRSVLPAQRLRGVPVSDRDVSDGDALVPEPDRGSADREGSRLEFAAPVAFRGTHPGAHAGGSRRAAAGRIARQGSRAGLARSFQSVGRESRVDRCSADGIISEHQLFSLRPPPG